MKIRVKIKEKPHSNNNTAKEVVNKDMETSIKEGCWNRHLVFYPGDESNIEYSCSCCGQCVNFISNYCPNCGAMMTEIER